MSLFDVDHPATGEHFESLVRCRNVVVERIAGSANVEPKLYDQSHDEWVALLRGSATIEIDGNATPLGAGDHVFIAAQRPHRVVASSADALWLAVHIHERRPPEPCTVASGSFAEIAALEAQIPEFDEHFDEGALVARVGDRRHLALLARVDGEPAGFKLGYEEHPGRFYSWIGGVLPAYRRRGVAQQLLDAQERWCRESGYEQLVVKSRNRFRAMIRFLVENGYDIHATQTNGAIVFAKAL